MPESQNTIALPDLPGVTAGWEILMLDERKVSGKYTADVLARDEERRNVVIECLAQGMPLRQISKAFDLSINVVLEAKRRWASEIETEKQRLGVKCMDVGRMAVERIAEEMGEMPRASLPIIAGIMIDKGQLLMGAPTARIERIDTRGVAELADYIASLPSVSPVAAEEQNCKKDSVDCLEIGENLNAKDSQSTASPDFPREDPANGTESGQNTPKTAEKGGSS
jgi:hypothetical protein